MSSAQICTTRSSAKRRRPANQEDAPLSRKIQKIAAKRNIRSPPQPMMVNDVEKKTQKRKARKSTKSTDPVDTIRPDDLARNGSRPLLRYYGWPFKYEQVLQYAQRHHFRFEVVEQARQLFGDREEMDFADLSEEHYSDPKLMRRLEKLALLLVCSELARRAGLGLERGCLLSQDWDGILYVWDNYNAEQQFGIARFLGSWEKGVKVMEEAMSEITGEKSKLQWWQSWENGARLRLRSR